AASHRRGPGRAKTRALCDERPMRFYQRILFRLIAGAVLLVSAVAVLLTLVIPDRSKEVLRQREGAAVFHEADLRLRAISAQIETLRTDVTGLVNDYSMRRFQWAEYWARNWWRQYELPEAAETFIPKMKGETTAAFDALLARRPRYLQIEYYLD